MKRMVIKMDLKKMRRISYVWGFLLFLLVGGLTAIGFVYKNKLKKYEDLENKLEESAKQYVDQKFLYPEANQNIKITLEELKREEFIDNLNVDDEECDGYEIVSHDGSTFQYKAYIKCSDYKTKNYDKNM